MAREARRARSSATARSCSEKYRPDSAEASVRAPNTRPRPASGATMEERGDSRDDLAAGIANGLGAERDDAVRAIGPDDVDLGIRSRLALQRPVHELGVGSGDRALGCAIPEQVLRALVGEQELARRG